MDAFHHTVSFSFCINQQSIECRYKYIWVKCYDFKWGPCFTEWTHLAKTFDLQVWPGPHRVVGCRLTQTVETWGTTFRGNGETERKREERRGNWKGERKKCSRKRYFQSLSLLFSLSGSSIPLLGLSLFLFPLSWLVYFRAKSFWIDSGWEEAHKIVLP